MKTGSNDRTRSRSPEQSGFTLLETMIVVAAVGILATYAASNYLTEQKYVKRTEVKLALDSLRDAQRAHFMEHGRYASTFDELPFLVGNAVQSSPTMMQSHRYTYVLAQPQGSKSYQVTCIGQLDNDAFPDVHIMDVVHP